MTQEEQILQEIEDSKKELRQSLEAVRRLENYIKEKEKQLYFAKLESPDKTLFRRLDIEGYMTDNCNRICEIVKNWLPPDLDGCYEYSDGWNDYRDECLANLK
jgi:hypothetical protein